ncbi:55_t:CDS:2, partial [Diversispora eburnea]
QIIQRLFPGATYKTVAKSHLVFHNSSKSDRATFSSTTESKTETLVPSLIFEEIHPISSSKKKKKTDVLVS